MLPLMIDSLALPITQVARLTAQKFGQQQTTPDKARQVYFNTLAVWVVKDYLSLMEIPFCLEASDCWNPIIRLCSDVADLMIPDIGRLECRPVLSATSPCVLPPDVWSDRIGYIVILIEDNHRKAQILGFTPTATRGHLPIDQLQPLESLLAHISEFMPSADTEGPLSSLCTDLGQWLNGVFDKSWQVVDHLLPPAMPEPSFQFRSAATTSTLDLYDNAICVKRAKLVQFKADKTEIPLVLIMNLLQTEADEQRMLCVQLRPAGDHPSLPENLILRVLDHQRNTFLEAQSRSADNYLQLEFSGRTGEQFHVDLEQCNQSISEMFVI
ncbi:DUF1822 family protein [Acaryochloris sp. IP29b_bin.137]|uniref:DUF1822 family protein n=1 Tax=Acaryochloris sp. IP29b_bin.137 TaxID=2969217 RepID=UPI0026055383|nr:DUF1822 family protein [Acaryochloris sp. IP29b_bin.137]